MDDARRRRLTHGTIHPAPLDEVVKAIVDSGAHRGLHIYVERRRSGYRWSIASQGGHYPLLREVAKLLEVDHRALLMPFDTVGGWAVVSPKQLWNRPPLHWAVLAPEPDPSAVRSKIASALTASKVRAAKGKSKRRKPPRTGRSHADT